MRLASESKCLAEGNNLDAGQAATSDAQRAGQISSAVPLEPVASIDTLMIGLHWAASLLPNRQEKHSDSNQQCNQNADNERDNPMPTLNGLRPSAFLRRSDAQPEEKVAHLPDTPLLADWLGLSAPFKRRSRSAQNSNRSNHQQPERKHSKSRNRLQS
jgi:hypothetical protein